MTITEPAEVYISVDVETSGPVPGRYSLLSIGACTVQVPRATFYIELKPISELTIPQAMQVSQLPLAKLAEYGVEPAQAMQQLKSWVLEQSTPDRLPVFVAFNAAFDWMFITYYFHHYLGDNPFGHSALDIKAFFMGLTGVTWKETSMRNISPHYLGGRQLSHHALQDALDQADLFQHLLNQARQKPPSSY